MYINIYTFFSFKTYNKPLTESIFHKNSKLNITSEVDLVLVPNAQSKNMKYMEKKREKLNIHNFVKLKFQNTNTFQIFQNISFQILILYSS